MCKHATLHKHIYTAIVKSKIALSMSALKARLDAIKEVMSGMVSWDETRRGKERSIYPSVHVGRPD